MFQELNREMQLRMHREEALGNDSLQRQPLPIKTQLAGTVEMGTEGKGRNQRSVQGKCSTCHPLLPWQAQSSSWHLLPAETADQFPAERNQLPGETWPSAVSLLRAMLSPREQASELMPLKESLTFVYLPWNS